MTDKDLDLFKRHQYCDNPLYASYAQVGLGNICICTRKNAQVYCNNCAAGVPEAPPFSVRRGTMFYGLRTPMEKIIRLLGLIASGIGVNALCRQEQVTADSLRAWVILAARHADAFTTYMQKNMHLEQVQIYEFWAFIRKKGKFDRI